MKGQISLLTLQIGEFTKVASNKLCIVKKYTICYFSATKAVRDQNQTNSFCNSTVDSGHNIWGKKSKKARTDGKNDQ